MDLPYPDCLPHTSLLTSWVLISSATSTCYERDYTPNCTFPDHRANPDLYPVYVVDQPRVESGLRNELLVGDDTGGSSVANTTYIVNGSVTKLTLVTAGSLVKGVGDSPYIETLVVSATAPTIKNVRIGNLTFPTGINFNAMRLENVTLETSAHIGPSVQQHTVNLDGSVVSNLRGGAIAFFRPTGTIHCEGEFTRCFLLQKIDPGAEPATVVPSNGAAVIDVTAITGIYGDAYLTDFFAFGKVAELDEASQLAWSLFWPAVAILVSIFLAHGRPRKLPRPEKKEKTPNDA